MKRGMKLPFDSSVGGLNVLGVFNLLRPMRWSYLRDTHRNTKFVFNVLTLVTLTQTYTSYA